jgi:ribosomal protein S15P/S13E
MEHSSQRLQNLVEHLANYSTDELSASSKGLQLIVKYCFQLVEYPFAPVKG